MRVILVLLLASCAMAQPGPDLVLYNGRIWTADEARPEAQAVAVARGRISAVGSDLEIRTLAGPSTTSIDLKGRLLLPGFIDNHAHFMAGGFQLQSVDLRAALTMRQFADLIADATVVALLHLYGTPRIRVAPEV